jgi:predicted dehydrogenase
LNGINTIIEKPISDSVKKTRQFLKSIRKSQTLVAVGYNLRHSESLNVFRSLIQENFIGEVISFKSEVGQYLPNWRTNIDYRKSVTAQKSLGGGVLLELSHEIDYIRWIFGPIIWVNGSALKLSSLEINTEDFVSATLAVKSEQFKKNLIGTLSMDLFRKDITRRCYAIGEKGTLSWDGINGEVKFFDPEVNLWQILYRKLPSANETYNLQLEHFLQSVSQKSAPKVSAEQGLEVLIIVNAIRKSSAKGKKVKISKLREIGK